MTGEQSAQPCGLGPCAANEGHEGTCAEASGWLDQDPGPTYLADMVYVAGFLFSPDGHRVALVRKAKPAWQAGKLNGIGGKLEDGESPMDAMRREFREETGLDLWEWEAFAVLKSGEATVFFFRAFGPVDDVRTMEAEPIEVHDVANINHGETIPNLSWLIPLARYVHDDYWPMLAEEKPATGPRFTEVA